MALKFLDSLAGTIKMATSGQIYSPNMKDPPKKREMIGEKAFGKMFSELVV